MNNKTLLDKLAAQLSILEHHIKRLKKNPEELHELDVDLMGEKIKEIYNLIHDLQPEGIPKKAEAPIVNEVEKVPMVEVKPEPEIPSPKAPEIKNEQAEVPPVPRPSSPEPTMSAEPPLDSARDDNGPEIEKELKDVPVVEAKEEPVVKATPVPEAIIEQPENSNEQPVATSQEPEVPPIPRPKLVPSEDEETPVPSNEQPITSHEEPETDPTPKTTADLFSGPTTIADSFQNGDDNSLAARVNPTVVQDLKMAIGINDKFLFINELFKGDPTTYNQAIDRLNTAGSVDAAEATIESFRGEFTWADNSEAYHRLRKIVMSKYNG